MLFFLTGDIQTGKTRWLQEAVGELADAGVPAYGVIAPGRWVACDGGFQKMGIDNVLLPQNERLPFAEPRHEGGGAEGVSGRIAGWVFNEAAVDRVNGHFRVLRGMAARAQPEDGTRQRAGLLVVDELGWLELLDGRGLVDALALLDDGASRMLPHALVVVRESLLPQAADRFARSNWSDSRILRPDAPSLAALRSAFSL